MPSILLWSIWIVFTLAWTAGLVLPISSPTFGDTEEIRNLVRFILSKGAHLSLYAAWTVLTGSLRAPFRYRLFLLMFLMFHAVATEWVQTFVPSRTGLLRDAAIDHLGIFLGVLISFRWWTQAD